VSDYRVFFGAADVYIRRMIKRILAMIGFACLAAASPIGSAQAHPHVWIDNRVTVEFEGGRVVALSMEWRFDTLFSAILLTDFDLDEDMQLDSMEADFMRRNAFIAIGDFSYFTHVKVDGVLVKWDEPMDFQGVVEGRAVVYRFRLPLPEPVDPNSQLLTIATYDRSFFVDVTLQKAEPVVLSGKGAASCHHQIVAKPDDSPNLWGVFTPPRIDITCQTS